MNPIDFRFHLTIHEIAHSEAFEENKSLFIQGIKILINRIKLENFSSLENEEEDILNEIFTKIEETKRGNLTKCHGIPEKSVK